MEELKDPNNQTKCAQMMSTVYNLPADEALGMFQDAHSTNWAENYQFFVNQNNPTNFERIWDQAYYLYRKIGVVTRPRIAFDEVMDYSIIRKLGQSRSTRTKRMSIRSASPRRQRQLFGSKTKLDEHSDHSLLSQ